MRITPNAIIGDADTIPLGFGKHKGNTPKRIAEIDPGYVVWLHDKLGAHTCSEGLYEKCKAQVEIYSSPNESDWYDEYGCFPGDPFDFGG
jgi:hypothetical protein